MLPDRQQYGLGQASYDYTSYLLLQICHLYFNFFIFQELIL